MRKLALGIALTACLGTSAAQALCTTGVECIRERFGSDSAIRNNRIIDQTDRLGDRGRPLNPYLAGTNVAGQARRAGRFDSTIGGTGGGTAGRTLGDTTGADPLRPGEVSPTDPSTPGSLVPGGIDPDQSGSSDLTILPYEPASPAAGTAGADRRGSVAQGTVSGRSTGPAAPARRDRNAPQGAANLRYNGPSSAGAYR